MVMEARRERRIRFSEMRQGNRDAFLNFCREHLNLVTEYLTCSGLDSVNRIVSATQWVFRQVWVQLGSARSPNDLEALLGEQLIKFGPLGARTTGAERHLMSRLALLTPEERLIIIAVDMEGWPIARVATMLGLAEEQVRRWLFSARCDLTGFQFIGLSESEKKKMIGDCARLGSGKVSKCIHHSKCREFFRQFKQGWLECLPLLIDLRQDMRFSGEEDAELLAGIADLVERDAPRQLPVGARVRSFFSGRLFYRTRSC